MKKYVALILLLLPFAMQADHPVRHVDRVIIWGHKLHTHTHSYIHWGFYRAFKHLGYETHWIDQSDAIGSIPLSNSLFITEGQVDQRMPVRDDCYYIIHNCNAAPYRHLLKNGHAIILQVYTHDCLDRKEPSFSQCFHYDLSQPIIYMPWATDLLPQEIDAMKSKIATRFQKDSTAVFVGTVAGGTFGNQAQVNGFKKGCQEYGINFNHGGAKSKSMEENIEMVQRAQLAPALQGAWQCEKGYIPCRIFKNISYGALGITNSKTVWELFDKKIVYDPNCYELAKKSIAASREWTVDQQYELMDMVKEKHTYITRIEQLFNFFEMVSHDKANV